MPWEAFATFALRGYIVTVLGSAEGLVDSVVCYFHAV